MLRTKLADHEVTKRTNSIMELQSDVQSCRRLISKYKKENQEIRRFNDKLTLDIEQFYKRGDSLSINQPVEKR